ncbi:hypothetical protein [Sphingorhabdus sp. Alg231-15]|uniref:hypothetical protein n=1 Tax=Sphingorhabdus sp. Alg231-15 TaxID=1922222 RepID=UPI000D550C61
MTKFSALSKGFVSKAVALIVIGAFSSTVGATQLNVVKQVDAVNGANNSAVPEKITDKRHPDYVRCRSEAIVGSLARKRKVCMTNKQWVEARKRGNRLADNMISAIQVMSGGGSFTDGK